MTQQQLLRNAQPEFGALLSTRRWLIVISASVTVGFTMLIAGSLFGRLEPLERAALLAGLLLLLCGDALSRRPWALWLIVASPLVLVAATFVPNVHGQRWIALNLLLGYATYFSVMMTSRATGLVVALAGPSLLAVVWSTSPQNAIVGNLGMFHGWGAVAQLGTSAFLIWIMWNRLSDEAHQADDRMHEAELRADDAVRAQERARLWRATATRLHESILNTIRYVLSAPQVDRDRLAVEVSRERMATPAHESAHALSAVVSAMTADPEVGARVQPVGWLPDTELDAAAFEAVRAAAIELTRNAVRHGGAQEVIVTARTDFDGALLLSLNYDGDAAPLDAVPGVGRAKVVDESLAEVGVSYIIERSRSGGSTARLRVPRPGELAVAKEMGRAFPPFDKGRLLVTSVLAGISMAGSVYFVALAVAGSLTQRISAGLGLIGIVVACALVFQRRRVSPMLAVPLVVAPALVPWFLLGTQYVCTDVGLIAPVINIAGFCVMVIAAWSGRLPGIVGVAIWAAGGGLLIRSLPQGCRDSVAVALINSLVALPVILSVTYAGARAYQRAQEEAQSMRLREVSERSRAAAAQDINDQLEATVAEAEHLLEQVAQGALVDDELRAALQRADGRIRAGIQVDPQSDGAIAVFAKAVVDDLAALRIVVNVRAITCSHDHRPLPLAVRRQLYRVLSTPVEPVAKLLVLTDGEEDHLSITTRREALRLAGLRPGAEVDVEDVHIDVEEGGLEADAFTIIVSRPVREGVTVAGPPQS